MWLADLMIVRGLRAFCLRATMPKGGVTSIWWRKTFCFSPYHPQSSYDGPFGRKNKSRAICASIHLKGYLHIHAFTMRWLVNSKQLLRAPHWISLNGECIGNMDTPNAPDRAFRSQLDSEGMNCSTVSKSGIWFTCNRVSLVHVRMGPREGQPE